MSQSFRECAANHISGQVTKFDLGRVVEVSKGTVCVSGFSPEARLGDRVTIVAQAGKIGGQVVSLMPEVVAVLLDHDGAGVSRGDRARRELQPKLSPDPSWLGRVIDPDGVPLDGFPILPGREPVELNGSIQNAPNRRPLGKRLETGHAVFNTMLPLVRGQRIGLFAGSGVGKSTLLGNLAKQIEVDVIVVALVGERRREVQSFVQDILTPVGMARSVVVAATSDKPAQLRRKCAPAAMAVAEFFRDQGKQVLLVVDSVTRFCEAHRELAVASGELANLHGHPASTAVAIAGLCERAGPGANDQGDITAIFSVLVAGSNMEEPVADMLRGVLDGHIVLDREIAERGRYPAVDVLRSVSRSLPAAASKIENDLISQARDMLGRYDRAELMLQAGLYVYDNDAETDKAIASFPFLDAFFGLSDGKDTIAHFAKLRQAILAQNIGES